MQSTLLRSFTAFTFAALAALVFAAAPALGQDRISSDRPGFGDGASTVGAGTIQAELGYQFTGLTVTQSSSLGTVDAEANAHELGRLLVRYGVNDFIELRAGIGSYSFVSVEQTVEVNGETQTLQDEDLDGYSGAGVGIQPGTVLGAKFRLFRNDVATVSFLSSTSLPIAKEEFLEGDDRSRQEFKLALDGALGNALTLSVNAGANFYWVGGEQEERYPIAVFTPALNFDLSEQIGAYVGYVGYYQKDDNENYVEGGLTFFPTSDTQLDVNGGLRVDDNVDSLWLIGLGLAQRF